MRIARPVLTALVLIASSFLAPAQEVGEDDVVTAVKAATDRTARLIRANKFQEARDAAGAAWSSARRLSEGDLESRETQEVVLGVGFNAFRAGAFSIALEAYSAVADVRGRRLPSDHPDVLTAREDISACLAALGEYDAARTILEDITTTLAKTAPLADPFLLRVQRRLALVHSSTGDLHAARELFEHVLAMHSTQLPEDHPWLHQAVTDLAAVLANLGDLEGARPLFESAVEGMARVRPPDDADLLRHRRNLISVLRGLGDEDAAREVEAVLGSSSAPMQLESMVLRILALLDDGDAEAARAGVEEALRLAAELSPEQVALARGSLYSLGFTAHRAGAPRATERAWTLATESLARERPHDDPDLQSKLSELGSIRHLLGETRAGEALCGAAVESLLRTVPEDDPRLLNAQQSLALVRKAAGDYEGARVLEERVLELRSRGLPADDTKVQEIRLNLGATLVGLEEYESAHALFEEAVQVFSRTKAAHDLQLLGARQSLSVATLELGDVEGALEIAEDVRGVMSRVLPEDHPARLQNLSTLAAVRDRLGEEDEAGELLERVLEARSRLLPQDHRLLQQSRLDMVDVLRRRNDEVGALRLAEAAFEVLARTSSVEDPLFRTALMSLGKCKFGTGDIQGAHAAFERAHDICVRTLPDDHDDLQFARQNLALTSSALGDKNSAVILISTAVEHLANHRDPDDRELVRAYGNLGEAYMNVGNNERAAPFLEYVHRSRARSRPADHPDVLRAAAKLALCKFALGDLETSRELLEEAYALQGAAPAVHAEDIETTRLALAYVRQAEGDLEGARVLLEQVHERWTDAYVDEHPNLAIVRTFLARVRHELGDLAGAHELRLAAGRAARARLGAWTLSPREAESLAYGERTTLSALLWGTTEPPTPEQSLEIAREALLLSQVLRGAGTRAARLRARARLTDPERAAVLAEALRTATAESARLPEAGALEPDGPVSSTRAASVWRAVQKKEAIEQELVELAGARSRVEAQLETSTLGACLPEGSVGMALQEVREERPGAPPGSAGATWRFAGFVLHRDGRVDLHQLPGRERANALVAAVRDYATGGARGVGLASTDGEDAPLQELRREFLDPLLADLPEGTHTIYLAVNGGFEIVPLDALPLESGDPLGSAYRLRMVTSLIDLVEEVDSKLSTAPKLVAFGGIDYDEVSEPAPRPVAQSAAPATRAGRPEFFRLLLDSETEARSIARTFEARYGEDSSTVVLGDEASKAALFAAAPEASFLHIATHGYFAPESVRSIDEAESPLGRFGHSSTGIVSAMSPLVLTGLALSGANLSPDEFGSRQGIATAEELMQLDLSRCFLATLSACESSLGVSRAGQGYASLRSALRGAGARYVLTSLWNVDDRRTMELMTDFYRRLWKMEQDPHDALWNAKNAARERGVPFRDWSGWSLVGR